MVLFLRLRTSPMRSRTGPMVRLLCATGKEVFYRFKRDVSSPLMSNFVDVCDLTNAPYELIFSLSSSRVFVASHRSTSESLGTTSPVSP